MKTASWFTYSGPGRIGISRGTPRNMPRGFRLYRPLNPTRALFEQGAYGEAAYREIVLAALDPRFVWDELHALVAPAIPVLLCYERPPFRPGNECHRRYIARWFEEKLGVEVPELDPLTATDQGGLFDR